MDEIVARRELSVYAKRLAWRGFVEGAEGNLSFRLDNDTVLIKPAKKEFCMLEPEDFVRVDLEGRKVSGQENPSSEYSLHINIYKHRGDANSVIHTHPDFVTALFSVLKEPLTMGMPAEASLGVSRIGYLEKTIPGSAMLAKKGAEALGKANAVILKDHGIIAIGKNIDEAFRLTIAIEKAAKWKLIGAVAETLNTVKRLDTQLTEILYHLKKNETYSIRRTSNTKSPRS